MFLSLQLDIVTSSEGATEIPSLVTRYSRLCDWFKNLFEPVSNEMGYETLYTVKSSETPFVVSLER